LLVIILKTISDIFTFSSIAGFLICDLQILQAQFRSRFTLLLLLLLLVLKLLVLSYFIIKFMA